MTGSDPARGPVDTPVLAVVVARHGRLPAGAEEAVSEADGQVLVVGRGAEACVPASARRVWWAETGTGPAALAAAVTALVSESRLVIVPASPDGRDLGPRLAARLGWPLLAGAVRCGLDGPYRPDSPDPPDHPASSGNGIYQAGVEAELLRADGRVVVPVSVRGPAVVTLVAGCRAPSVPSGPPDIVAVQMTRAPSDRPDPSDGPAGSRWGRDPDRPGDLDLAVQALVEPDPAAMDLAEAARVIAGGAGLVRPGASDAEARATFSLLAEVATALGASAGATRVVTDAGWTAADRQIGTTGATLDPQLYVALGVSGATQHVGGIGDPAQIVSVNVDPSCPMTAMANLGLVADAPAVLVELARRLSVPVPPGLPR